MSVNTDLPLRGGIGKYATHILGTPPAAHGLGGAAPGAHAHEGDGAAGDAYGVAPGDVDPEQREDLCGGRVRSLRIEPDLVSSSARQERGRSYVGDGVAASDLCRTAAGRNCDSQLPALEGGRWVSLL